MGRARRITRLTGARFHRLRGLASCAVALTVMCSAAHAGHSTQEPETEQAGNVLFVRPPGWQRHNQPDGTVLLVPPDVSARQVALAINPGRERQDKDLRHWFNASWEALLQANGAKVLSGGDVRGGRRRGVEALSTSAVLQSATGARTYTAFFVSAPGTRVEAVLFVASSDTLYAKYLEPVLDFMAAVRFANLP